ncbi:MAG: alpha/beta hydrolase [Rhodospirillales bacterium]|nr:MAG: alpha/beta hydrolase [Rhodospirillales bacterium]
MPSVTMLLTVAAVLVGGYGVLVAGMSLMQRSLLYLPASDLGTTPREAGVPEMRGVVFTTEDGLNLTAWHRPPTTRDVTLVYFHGNGGHIGYRGPRVRPFLDAGYGVLLVGYRGYGGNPGRPTEDGLYADGRAALAFLNSRGFPAGRLVLYGESLGGGVAVRMAAEQARADTPVAAVVLEAPMSSVTDVAAHHYPFLPVRWLLKDRFETVPLVAEIAAPLFVAHGTADRVVPIRFGRKIFEAAREPREAFWVEGGGHENLSALGLHDRVLDFLDRHGTNEETRPGV